MFTTEISFSDWNTFISSLSCFDASSLITPVEGVIGYPKYKSILEFRAPCATPCEPVIRESLFFRGFKVSFVSLELYPFSIASKDSCPGQYFFTSQIIFSFSIPIVFKYAAAFAMFAFLPRSSNSFELIIVPFFLRSFVCSSVVFSSKPIIVSNLDSTEAICLSEIDRTLKLCPPRIKD